MDYKKLAQLLLPDADSDLSKLEQRFPARELPEGAKVTRFAPSPTGLPHLGNVFTCNINLRLAHQSGGVCLLRIEDTDAKRTVDDGVNKIIKMLGEFGIFFDEGPTASGEEKGDYGPYIQSQRNYIYHCCAKYLIEQGNAYPCFCSEEELDAVREQQKEACVAAPGYFGQWARCRELSYEEIEANVKAGKPFVIRMKSPGDATKTDRLTDTVRGVMEFPQNIMDIVILKSDGTPPYHFAHPIDDHFMHITDVVRGDEWLATAPIHVQLFRLLGFKQPRYTHVAPLSKIEDGNKRKLSKRKDPEFGLVFYHEMGYDKDALLEYLTGVANSAFEDWRRANPDAPLDGYKFNIKNLSVSGAVFDLAKLDDVSKNYISRLSADEVLARYTAWAALYDGKMHALVTADPKRWHDIFNIERETPKPRKDIDRWGMVSEYYSYFINERFGDSLASEGYCLPEGSDAADFKAACAAYAEVYDPADDRDSWFAKVKAVAEKLGYATDTKAYKADPSAFKGQLSQIAAFLRIAITGRTQTPDLHTIMGILGRDECEKRLIAAAL